MNDSEDKAEFNNICSIFGLLVLYLTPTVAMQIKQLTNGAAGIVLVATVQLLSTFLR